MKLVIKVTLGITYILALYALLLLLATLFTGCTPETPSEISREMCRDHRDKEDCEALARLCIFLIDNGYEIDYKQLELDLGGRK